MAFDHDVAIIGSGFGGSVSALRLTEKGYDVAVIEAGRRWTPDNMPRSDYDMRNYLWFPKLGMRGMMRMSLLRNVFILSGSAVGGGSVVYANTLYRPLERYWDDAQWAHISDWRDEYAAWYDQAERMLGVNPVPGITNADRLMQKVADRMGVADTFHPTNVGVWFGTPGERVADPYFGGEGPDRVGCIHCGGCMVGCRHEAKNSLDHNYLYLAEKNGAQVLAERQVTDVVPLTGGGFRLTLRRPGGVLRKDPSTLTAEQVIFSAGALGTAKLLHRLKDEGRLPNVSDKLGSLTRTNSEALVGAASRNLDTDYSQGVAITSSIHPDEHTHIEPVRYPKGSGATVGMLSALMVDGGGRIPRWLRFFLMALVHPILFLRSMFTYRRVAERSIILLVMQSLDNSLQVFRRKTPLGSWLSSRQGHGEPNPTWIPAANEAARIAADEMDGVAVGSIFEALFDIPSTAHIIGGCPIGDSPETGVIDPWHRLY
ncbi:MAG: GMC family oxidoreductase, partial [Nitriliruptorales bacterium]|nr:GMC family oxidoreductase [Nitriliruptorales bacterium]